MALKQLLWYKNPLCSGKYTIRMLVDPQEAATERQDTDADPVLLSGQVTDKADDFGVTHYSNPLAWSLLYIVKRMTRSLHASVWSFNVY